MSAESMSITALRQSLVEKLGERDAKRFNDVHLQNLLDKEYKDEHALQDATCEGLQSSPAASCADRQNSVGLWTARFLNQTP